MELEQGPANDNLVPGTDTDTQIPATQPLHTEPVVHVPDSIPRRFSVISLVPLPSNTAITGQNGSHVLCADGEGFTGLGLGSGEAGDTAARKLPQCIAVFVATIGSFGLGTVLGWTAPALDDLRRSTNASTSTNASVEPPPGLGPLGTTESSWIASLALLGALFSGLLSGLLINRFGRRRTMLYVAAPLFFAGWLLIAFAQNYAMIFAGRFVTGYAGGTFPLAVPIYVSEVTEDRLRGVLGSLMVLMLVIGMLFSFVVGSAVGWSQLSGICGAVPIVLALGLLFVPESPRYLLLRGNEAEAHKALVWLRGDWTAAEKEFELIKASIATERESKYEPDLDQQSPKRNGNGNGNGTSSSPTHTRTRIRTWTTLRSPSILKPALICILLMFFQQFGGINGIISYTVEIFRLVGPNLDANLASIILSVLQVVMVVASMALVDRVGRKVLLIGSEVIMCAGLIALGAFFYIKDVVDKENTDKIAPTLNWLPFIALVSYIVAYSVGMGPVPWLLTMELLNPAEKGTTTSCVTMSYWLLAFVSTKTFEDIGNVAWIGWHGCYWAFAVNCLLAIVFIAFVIPETKGKSSIEIQRHFSGQQPNEDGGEREEHLDNLN